MSSYRNLCYTVFALQVHKREVTQTKSFYHVSRVPTQKPRGSYMVILSAQGQT